MLYAFVNDEIPCMCVLRSRFGFLSVSKAYMLRGQLNTAGPCSPPWARYVELHRLHPCLLGLSPSWHFQRSPSLHYLRINCQYRQGRVYTWAGPANPMCCLWLRRTSLR
jgi:hypothetical protein